MWRQVEATIARQREGETMTDEAQVREKARREGFSQGVAAMEKVMAERNPDIQQRIMNEQLQKIAALEEATAPLRAENERLRENLREQVKAEVAVVQGAYALHYAEAVEKAVDAHPLDVSCPVCGAGKNSNCLRGCSGPNLHQSHNGRRTLAIRSALAPPESP